MEEQVSGEVFRIHITDKLEKHCEEVDRFIHSLPLSVGHKNKLVDWFTVNAGVWMQESFLQGFDFGCKCVKHSGDTTSLYSTENSAQRTSSTEIPEKPGGAIH